MAKSNRWLSPLAAAAGVALVLGAPAWAARGPKISVKDDPSMKEGAPGLVLVEVADFQ